ncbi:MAG: hypothetical protein ACN4EJ_05625 [Porticoccaceae bacterium]
MSRQSKRQIRDQLKRETQAYLARGGEINRVTQGQSGLTHFTAGRSQSELFIGAPRQPRTYLNESVQALEQRKQTAKVQRANKPRTRPRKKIIYDDFGEPLREVWVDE